MGSELKLKLTKDHCDTQLNLVRSSYQNQMDLLLKQSDTLVSDITSTYSERLREVSSLAAPQKPSWYQHPMFWGIIGAVGGTALGISIGAIIWK